MSSIWLIAFEAAATSIGASPDECKIDASLPIDMDLLSYAVLTCYASALVKLVFSFLLSFPLAAILKRIPDTTPERKNLFAIWYD